MNEFSLIEKYFQPLSPVLLNDDAAVLSIPQGYELVVTSDTLNEGVHFPQGAGPADIARKALRVNLSDLAAMGAVPYAYQLNLALPVFPGEAWLKAFAGALHADQEEFGIFCSGGDTTSIHESLSVSITAMGLVPKGRAVMRSGAKAGDALLLTGPVGDAFCGLKVLQGVLDMDDSGYLVGRYYRPTPRLVLAEDMQAYARAAVDVSDGFVADLGHLCKASGVGVTLKAKDIYFSDAARALLGKGRVSAQELLTGGDDYELLLAVPPENTEKFPQACILGHFEPGRDVRILDERGHSLFFLEKGWQHFK